MNLIKKVLKEYKLLKQQEIAAIDLQIKDLQTTRTTLVNDVITATKELQAICIHKNTNKVPGTYMSGGYDHVSEQPYTIQCVDCGKVLESYCIRGTYA